MTDDDRKDAPPHGPCGATCGCGRAAVRHRVGIDWVACHCPPCSRHWLAFVRTDREPIRPDRPDPMEGAA